MQCRKPKKLLQRQAARSAAVWRCATLLPLGVVLNLPVQRQPLTSTPCNHLCLLECWLLGYYSRQRRCGQIVLDILFFDVCVIRFLSCSVWICLWGIQCVNLWQHLNKTLGLWNLPGALASGPLIAIFRPFPSTTLWKETFFFLWELHPTRLHGMKCMRLMRPSSDRPSSSYRKKWTGYNTEMTRASFSNQEIWNLLPFPCPYRLARICPHYFCNHFTNGGTANFKGALN
jgi:hypothetical protein